MVQISETQTNHSLLYYLIKIGTLLKRAFVTGQKVLYRDSRKRTKVPAAASFHLSPSKYIVRVINLALLDRCQNRFIPQNVGKVVFIHEPTKLMQIETH